MDQKIETIPGKSRPGLGTMTWSYYGYNRQRYGTDIYLKAPFMWLWLDHRTTNKITYQPNLLFYGRSVKQWRGHHPSTALGPSNGDILLTYRGNNTSGTEISGWDRGDKIRHGGPGTRTGQTRTMIMGPCNGDKIIRLVQGKISILWTDPTHYKPSRWLETLPIPLPYQTFHRFHPYY